MRETTSQASSRTGSTTLSRSARLEERMMEAFLLPAIAALLYDYSFFLSLLSVIVECLQCWGFIMNPHFPGHQMLATVVYSTHLPLWDGTMLGGFVSYDVYTAFYIVYCSLIVLVVGFLCVAPWYVTWFTRWLNNVLIRHVTHLMLSALCIPIFLTLLSGVMCQETAVESREVRSSLSANVGNSFRSHILFFSEVSCDAVKPRVLRVFSIALVALWGAVSYGLSVTLLPVDRDCRSLRRHFNVKVDLFLYVYKVGLSILFVLMQATNHREAFAIVTAFASFVGSAGFCFFLPYYVEWMNRLFAMVFAVVGWNAVTVFIALRVDGLAFVDQHYFYIVLGVGAVLCAGVAYWLSGIRLNPVTSYLLARCVGCNFVPFSKNPFAIAAMQGNVDLLPYPHGLPQTDALVSPYYAVSLAILEDYLREEAEYTTGAEPSGRADGGAEVRDAERRPANEAAGAHNAEENDAGQAAGRFPRRTRRTGLDLRRRLRSEAGRRQVVSSTLSHVYTATDACIAVRFLHKWTTLTQTPPTPFMVYFASRILNRFLLHYPRSGMMVLVYISFLCDYAPSHARLMLCLEMIRTCVSEYNLSITERFLLHYFNTHIHDTLGMRSAVYEAMHRRIRQLHDRVLLHENYVWRALLEKSEPRVLYFFCTSFARERHRCFTMYMSALSMLNDDGYVLRNLGSFFGDVYNFRDTEKVCRNTADVLDQLLKARLRLAFHEDGGLASAMEDAAEGGGEGRWEGGRPAAEDGREVGWPEAEGAAGAQEALPNDNAEALSAAGSSLSSHTRSNWTSSLTSETSAATSDANSSQSRLHQAKHFAKRMSELIQRSVNTNYAAVKEHLRWGTLTFWNVTCAVVLLAFVAINIALIFFLFAQWQRIQLVLYDMANVRLLYNALITQLHRVREQLPDDAYLGLTDTNLALLNSNITYIRSLIDATEAAHHYVLYGRKHIAFSDIHNLLSQVVAYVRVYSTFEDYQVTPISYITGVTLMLASARRAVDFLLTTPSKDNFIQSADIVMLTENAQHEMEAAFETIMRSLTKYESKAINQYIVGVVALLIAFLCVMTLVGFIILWNYRRAAGVISRELSLYYLLPQEAVRRLAGEAQQRLESFRYVNEVRAAAADELEASTQRRSINLTTLAESGLNTARQTGLGTDDAASAKLLSHLIEHGALEVIDEGAPAVASPQEREGPGRGGGGPAHAGHGPDDSLSSEEPAEGRAAPRAGRTAFALPLPHSPATEDREPRPREPRETGTTAEAAAPDAAAADTPGGTAAAKAKRPIASVTFSAAAGGQAADNTGAEPGRRLDATGPASLRLLNVFDATPHGQRGRATEADRQACPAAHDGHRDEATESETDGESGESSSDDERDSRRGGTRGVRGKATKHDELLTNAARGFTAGLANTQECTSSVLQSPRMRRALIFTVLTLFLIAASLGCIVELMTNQHDVDILVNDADASVRCVANAMNSSISQLRRAANFVVDEQYKSYTDASRAMMDSVLQMTNCTFKVDASSLVRAQQLVRKNTMIAMTMTASNLVATRSDGQREMYQRVAFMMLENMTWTRLPKTVVNEKFFSQYLTEAELADWVPYTNNTYDLAQEPDTRRKLAYDTLFGPTGIAEMEYLISSSVAVLNDVAKEATSALKTFIDSQVVLKIASIVLCCAAVVTAFVACFSYGVKSRFFCIMQLCFVGCIAVVLTTSFLEFQQYDTYMSKFAASFTPRINAWKADWEYTRLSILHMAYIYTANDRYMRTLLDYASLGKLQASEYAFLPLTIHENDHLFAHAYEDALGSALLFRNYLWLSVVATVHANSEGTLYLQADEVAKMRWDMSKDPAYMRYKNMYPLDTFFSTYDADITSSTPDKMWTLAKKAAASHLLRDLGQQAEIAFDGVTHQIREWYSSYIETLFAKDKNVTYCILSFAVASLAIVLGEVAYLAWHELAALTMAKSTAALHEFAFSRDVRNAFLLLGLLAVLVGVADVTCIYALASWSSLGERTLKNLNSGWLVTGMTSVAASLRSQPTLLKYMEGRELLRQMLAQSTHILAQSFTHRNEVRWLHETASSWSKTSNNSDMGLDTRHHALRSVCIDPTSAGGNQQLPAVQLFAVIDLLTSLAYLPGKDVLGVTAVQIRLDDLFSRVGSLFYTIFSFSITATAAIERPMTVYYVVCCTAVGLAGVVVIALYVCVLSRVENSVRQLSVGIKLQLLGLPDSVLNTVPEIREFYNPDAGSSHDKMKRKLQQSERLLQNILPPSISRRLKNGERVIADSHASVTAVFAALVGFDEYSSQLDSKQIVLFLNGIVVAFDHIVDLLDLEKVKTIGDIYFFCGGLIAATESDHPVRCMECSLFFFEALEVHNSRHGTPNIKLRVGMNTDSAVAGVIGNRKVAYDLWGDCVNTASRMYSTGIPGRIQVSHSTYEQVCTYYKFEDRHVQAKGKGTLLTHVYVERLKNTAYSDISWQQGGS